MALICSVGNPSTYNELQASNAHCLVGVKPLYVMVTNSDTYIGLVANSSYSPPYNRTLVLLSKVNAVSGKYNDYYSASYTRITSFSLRSVTINGIVYNGGELVNLHEGAITDSTIPLYDTMSDFALDIDRILYPITYHYTNSTVTGPLEAAVGDTVTVSAVPNAGYGITDATTQILVTNNDVAVPYTWDATTNHITFTIPDPS